MTIKQKLVLFVGFIAIALMVIYPPIRFTVSKQTPYGVSAHTEFRYERLFSESINKVYYSRLILQGIIVLAVTFGLFAIFGRTQKSAAKRVGILAEINENLQQEIEEGVRIENRLRKRIAEMTSANEKLRREINEVSKAVNKWTKDRDQLEQPPKQQSIQPADPQETPPSECAKAKETKQTDQENQNISDSQGEFGESNK
ncbi:hypothetical protein ACFL02_04255 [Planctomycetota bacterium]